MRIARDITPILIAVMALATLAGCQTGGADDNDAAIRARTDELRRQREAAMREADTGPAIAIPPGNVRVGIERHEFDTRDRTAIDAFFKYRDEHTKVAVGGDGPRGGLRAAAMSDAPGRASGGVGASSDSRTATRFTSQFLLMTPGSTASMQVLRIEPRPWVVVVPTRRGGAALVELQRLEVTGSGVEVTVERVTGDGVDLVLHPYFNAAREGKAVRVDELTTRLRVPAGRRIAIYADASDERSVASSWLSRREQTTTSQTIIVLRVDLP